MLLTSSSTYSVLRIDDIRNITWLRFEMRLTSPFVFLSILLTWLTTTPCFAAGSDGTTEFQNNGKPFFQSICRKCNVGVSPAFAIIYCVVKDLYLSRLTRKDNDLRSVGKVFVFSTSDQKCLLHLLVLENN